MQDRGRSFWILALLTVLGCAEHPPAAPRSFRFPATEEAFAARQVRFLEIAFRELRYPRPGYGPSASRYATGALAAAALASRGQATTGEAARWAEATLAACDDRWDKVECETVLLSLQRLVLDYPQILPPELLSRLRKATSDSAPAPEAEEILHPWEFKETENQRALKLARSLVAQVVSGTPESPLARSWGAYAVAFLAAHARDGWYEEESPGYLGLSIASLLQLADYAPQAEVRRRATRELNVLFAAWAQEQVGGFPAGAKSRSYVHWALGAENTPWQAWAWLVGGLGEEERIFFLDGLDLAVTHYRVPLAVRRLLALRRNQAPYEIRARRTIEPGSRRPLNAARYSYATPDYILGAAQSLHGFRLSVSGGQEILATLYAEGRQFAPVYLWSRTRNPTSYRWRSWADQDLALADKNVILVRLGATGEATGHAYLSPAWSRPEPVGQGNVVIARYGGTYIALITHGGWEVAPAPRRFPGYYAGDPVFREAWVAVPLKQPADVAMEVGRQAEAGDFANFRLRVASLRLSSGARELRFAASDGRSFTFEPGERATLNGAALDVASYPLLAGPFLENRGEESCSFTFGGERAELTLQ
ncbi:MAG TPA: hypothetical protein VMM92_03085 [Thermoanaerobaculia bacterium]|nr:hypothetical protein [Thermoanaerobaculia bacterium]